MESLQPDILFHNRYRLIKKIGQGAFGEVWKAKDELTDTNIAIKVYIALDESGIENFKMEFRTVYSMNHHNLLRPEFYDIEGKRPFLIMHLCKYSLEHLIGEMKEEQIWKMIYDVANGLEYLHSNDIVHRDIKPDNILVSEEGIYLISDFGISTRLRSTMRRNSIRQNSENSFSGTISYMAPEMFTSERRAVKATDIWALGATLYEVIAGELPFLEYGGSLQNKGADIPNVSEDISNDLREVINACLAKETWERPLASELAEYAGSKIKGVDISMPWKARSNKDEKTKTSRKTERKTVDKKDFKEYIADDNNHNNEQQINIQRHRGRNYLKWIVGMLCLALGWAFGGISGAIIGCALGTVIIMMGLKDNKEKKKGCIWMIVLFVISFICVLLFENIRILKAERKARETAILKAEQEKIRKEQEAAYLAQAQKEVEVERKRREEEARLKAEQVRIESERLELEAQKAELMRLEKEKYAKTHGTINGHEWVDLGLPSGLKWATCNVGANKPEDYGNYYAWGETKTKSSYTRDNYVTYIKKSSDIGGDVRYDAARANWGSTWRLPTQAEYEELHNKSTWKLTTMNGVKGYMVTGPNGNSIFLPSAGHYDVTSSYYGGDSLIYAGKVGAYWTSTLDDLDEDCSGFYLFNSRPQGVMPRLRGAGHSVRPVIE